MRFFIAALAAYAVMALNFEIDFKPSLAKEVTEKVGGNERPALSADDANNAEASASALTGPPETTAVASPAEEEIAESGPETERPSKSFCDALKEAAESSDIPVAFFARLLWQESRFQSSEVSPVGAQGVAQFMPRTAVEVGLDDPFDPFKALPASAKFLRKLHNEFGNLGLAAAAYNAGSGRIQKWLSRQGGLPRETRDYVRIITGNAAENWTDESRTISLRLELPREAPCEGVGGLSKAKEVASVPVALAPSISDMIRKAEAQRIAAAKLDAAKDRANKSKARIALSLKNRKTPPRQLADIQELRKAAASRHPGSSHSRSAHASVLPKNPVRSRTKAAERSRQVRVASATRERG
jgi:Transglycosylase SLT domain